jgi:hypothetical protein
VAIVFRPLGKHGMLRFTGEHVEPAEPLVLYSDWRGESRAALERIDCLELATRVVTVPRGSAKRVPGNGPLPCLVDGDNAPLHGLSAIVAHLDARYRGDRQESTETFANYSTKGASKEHGKLS